VRSRVSSRVRRCGSICLLTSLIFAALGTRYPLNAATGSFNFALANAGNRTVAGGSSVWNTITVVLTSGVTKLVPFSVSGLPAGASAIFSPTSCSPPCSTTLTIFTAPTTPVGTSTIVISGVVSGLVRTTTFALTVTGPAGIVDTTAPNVALSAPTDRANVGGSVVIEATASDNTAVAGVQFLLDDEILGSELTTASYAMIWDTTTATDGQHFLSSLARDAAGNIAISASVSVIVDNGLPTGSVVINGGASLTNTSTVTLALSAADALSPVTLMRFSNSGTTYSLAEPFAPQKAWTLSSGGGTKTVFAQFQDAAGNWSAPATDTIVVDAAPPDTTPPTVALTSPASNATVTGSSVAITATASDDTAVAGVQFLRDGASLGAEDTTAPYAVTWDTTTATDGPHVLSSRARDAAGNTTTAAIVSVIVDNGLPSGSVVINGGASLTNAGTVTLTLSAADALSQVTLMRFSNSGTSYSPAEPFAAGKTWTLSPGSGTKTVFAQFQDAAGNWSAPATDTIVVDDIPPAMSAVTASNIGPDSATITWTTDEPATSQVEYGQGTAFTNVTAVDASLVSTHAVVIPGLTAKTAYIYRVRSRDAAGNESIGSTNTLTAAALPDTTAPTIALTSPASNATVTGSSVAVTATAADDTAVAGVQFLLDGASLGSEDTTAPYSVTWDTTTAADGPHVVSSRARDAAGNSTTAGGANVTVDNGLPTGSVVINANAAVSNSRTVALTLSASDAVGPVTQMRFSNSGTSYSPAEAYGVAKTWTLAAGIGTRTVYAQFRDAAGNWSAPATDTIVVDDVAPVISGATASTVQTDSAIISWTTDEPATSQVEFGAGTAFTSVTPVDSTLVTAHTVVVSGLASGTAYVYRVHSRDAVSNEGIGPTNSFTTLRPADTAPPSVPGGVSATAMSTTSIAVNWLASADDVAVAGYEVFRGATRVATVTTTSYSDVNLLPSTTYSYTVSAFDAANNHSAASSASAATTLPDQTPPSVSISSPANAATVAGTVMISAMAQDDIAVAGVRFQVDGSDVGTELSTAPFTTSVDTTKLSDGDHILTAIARDTSNNTAVSSVSVTVGNKTTTPGVPTLIQHVTTSSNYDPSELGNNFKIHLADPALANNCIILGIRYPDALARTVTIRDDKGNAWLNGPTASLNGVRARIFYVTGVVAGTRDITVTFDKALSGFQAEISEFYNVAVNFAFDGSSSSATSANPAIAAGSLTTTMPGDLIYNYVTTNNYGAPITGVASGTGFTLLSADRLRASAAQYAVQAEAGAITPAMTVTSVRGSMNSLAIALKAATAGTPPAAGIRVVHVYHGYWLGTPAKLQFPSTGNLLVLATSFGTGNSNVSSIASTPANTWTKVALAPVQPTDPQMLYAANAATGPDLEFAITASLKFVQFVMYDITGASTAPFDGAAKATGNDLANETALGAPQISSTGPGLIIATLPMGHGPPVDCTTTGCLFDGVTYPGEADGSTFESSDGYAHLYNTTPGWTSFDWKPAALDLPSAWFALAVGFRSQ